MRSVLSAVAPRSHNQICKKYNFSIIYLQHFLLELYGTGIFGKSRDQNSSGLGLEFSVKTGVFRDFLKHFFQKTMVPHMIFHQKFFVYYKQY